MTEDFKSVTEAAEILGTTRQGVWYHYKSGKLPNAQMVGKSIIIPTEDLDALSDYLNGRHFRKAGA